MNGSTIITTLEKVKCILIIDDEKIQKFLRIRFHMLGHEVLSATTGIEALDIIESRNPNLIILETVLPKMDGLDLIKQIKSITNAPVIIISTLVEERHELAGIAASADDYLHKPFNPDELVEHVEAFLSF